MKIISISYNELLLYDEDADSEIGKIKSSMWTGKAEIFTQEAHYLIKSTGFWGVNKSLFHKEQALFSLKMGWSGNYEIRSLQEETSDFFTVKTKGFDYKHF